jgi:threonine synthase
MDIQISSNFERLLFEVHDRDASAVRRLMDELAKTGAFGLDANPLAAIRADFAAGRADEAETAATIRETYRATNFLADPHSAVGIAVARKNQKPGVPMISLATAHPAKFPDAVRAAARVEPALPAGIGDLLAREERFTVIANDAKRVETFIADHARKVPEKV